MSVRMKVLGQAQHIMSPLERFAAMVSASDGGKFSREK